MTNEQSFEIIGEIKDDVNKIKELQQKLKETEEKLNELNRTLEHRVIERTVEVRRLLKHKIKFIDSLSHDLATPLTPIITLLPTLKDDLKHEDNKKLLDTCIRNAEYIKRVVNNTRELADISSTDIILKKENLHEIIVEIVKKYDIIFKSSSIKVENNISEEVFIKTEKSRIVQLLDHISSNAVNSMPQGGTLTFESKPDPAIHR